MSEKIGTYVVQVNNIFYAAFAESIVRDFTGMTYVEFIENDFPLFDEGNPLVIDSDLREISFEGKKMKFFISDVSSLIHQLRLGLSEKQDTVNILCARTTILLTDSQAKGFLKILEEDATLREQETTWHIENSKQNELLYKEGILRMKHKYIVV